MSKKKRKSRKAKHKITIEELETILDSEDETSLEIMPNGEICSRDAINSLEIDKKPLTLREDLGGEYSKAS